MSYILVIAGLAFLWNGDVEVAKILVPLGVFFLWGIRQF